MSSRREVLVGLGAAAIASRWPLGALAEAFAPPLYPSIDLARFNTPVTPAPADVRFGYAAITWDGNDRQAIEDIAALGFGGIQLRANVLKEFGEQPAALRQLLARHHLTMVALSSGAVKIDRALEQQVVEEHTSHARFVRDVGGIYLQVTDDKPTGRPVSPDDCKRLGALLTSIGKRTADLGIPLGYHNHMNSIGERPDDVDRILDGSDARYVKLELDVAHYQQGGGNPVEAIRRYHDRLLFLHIKDVESPIGSGRSGGSGKSGGSGGSPDASYRFVELGRGKVDLKGVFAALHDVKFRGWAIVELDSVPDKSRTPKESAVISKRYLEEQIGLRVSATPGS